MIRFPHPFRVRVVPWLLASLVLLFPGVLRAQAEHLAFDQQPTDTEAGAPIAPPVTVRAVDDGGTLDPSFEGSVTLAIGTNPGGGTLSGTTTVTAVDGVATFDDLSIEAAGSGYTLVASASGLDPATSAAFAITPGPPSGANSTISASPSSVPADGSSTSTITVELFDAFGNRLEAGGDAIVLSTTAGTLGPETDHGDGTYTATLTAPSEPATATVTGTVNDETIDDTATVTFTEVPPTATRLVFGQQPTDTEAGATIAPPVTVRAVDDDGTLDAGYDSSVTIAIGTNPGGGTLSGTTTVTAVDGVATFGDLSIATAASGYTLVADDEDLTPATSAAFAIAPGPASGATSTISASPTSLPADGSNTSTITVELLDAFGNPLETGGDTVVLSTTAGTLGSVTDHGNGTYSASLKAPSSPATATVSGTVNDEAIDDTATVTFTETAPAATALAFDQQPTTTEAGATIAPPVTVHVVDDDGILDAGYAGSVRIAIGTNPGGGTLSGTTLVTAVDGVATFDDLSIAAAGSGYTLVASASGVRSAISGVFAITPGPASGATSTIAASPSSVPADGSSTSTITVELLDAFGNPLGTGGDAVVLSTTAGTLGPVTDHGDGTYSATLTAPSATATATVSGTVDGEAIADTATVTFGGSASEVPTDLEVAASVSDATPTVGQVLVYTITVTNRGPARATGVEVTYEIVDRLEYIGSTPSQGSYDPAQALWSAGSLAPGATATLEIQARVSR